MPVLAKFLLGAANRRPQEAARHFHGYAVLVIGALKGGAAGVQRGIEPHELEDSLQAYLGPQFPAFELGRIGVDAANEVLFVIAQPPRDGQTIFPCHKGFQGGNPRDSLVDGAIYVRGTSNTRPARSGEVLALVERARGGGRPPIDLKVEVFGPVSRVDCVDEVLERLYEYEEEQFSKPQQLVEGRGSALLAASVFGRTKPLSPEERAERLDAWRNKKSAHISQGREYFLGVSLPGAGIKVVSRDRFVDKPQLIVTFHGCEAIDHREPDDADYSKLVEPVVRQQNSYGIGFDPTNYRISPRGYPVAWGNRGEDAEVVLTPDSFRPNVPWESDRDDYVILARDSQAETVTVSWVLTEDGNDALATGDLEVPTGDLVDATELLKSAFFHNQ